MLMFPGWPGAGETSSSGAAGPCAASAAAAASDAGRVEAFMLSQLPSRLWLASLLRRKGGVDGGRVHHVRFEVLQQGCDATHITGGVAGRQDGETGR